MTALAVVVERSPGGGRGYHVQVSDVTMFGFGGLREALHRVRTMLYSFGATLDEEVRVSSLVERELSRCDRADVTAEVPLPGDAVPAEVEVELAVPVAVPRAVLVEQVRSLRRSLSDAARSLEAVGMRLDEVEEAIGLMRDDGTSEADE